ncbi:MAG: glycosyltransferase [Candidatus Hydrogenedentes bacterium]|nr:glycosyltransferase [Candidatus Hydrogenedentota bacterium]
MAPRLSIAMIVRNEAALLPECLDCIAPAADEICVVDTGSDDETLAIAATHGCRTAVFPWNNDFAMARNASLDLCTGDWVFVLDADERLAAKDLPRLRALISAPPTHCFRFTTRNFTNAQGISDFVPAPAGDPAARGFAGWFPSVKVRLFPRLPGVCFENRVHELVTPSLARLGIAIEQADIPIYHYPLLRAPDDIRRKQELYVELGRAKVAERPGDAQAHAELGSQYAELGDYRNAVAAFREAVRLDPASGEYLKDLGATLSLFGKPQEAEQALLLAVQRAPGLADAWRNLGVLAANRSAWHDAVHYLRQALALQPDSNQVRDYLHQMEEHLNEGPGETTL